MKIDCIIDCVECLSKNLFKHLNLMHRLSIDDLPKNFNNTFKKPDHKYPIKFSVCNYSLKKYSLKSSKFAVSYGGKNCGMIFLVMKKRKLNLKYFFKKE